MTTTNREQKQLKGVIMAVHWLAGWAYGKLPETWMVHHQVIWMLGEPSHVLSLPLKHLVVTFSSPHKGLPSTHQAILFSQGHRSTSERVLLDRENLSCTAGIRRCCLESMSVCFVFLASEIVPRECESEEFSKRSDTLWCLVPPRATGLNYRKKEEKLFSSVNQSHVCSLNSRNLLLRCIAKTLQALKVHIHCWKTSDSLLKKKGREGKPCLINPINISIALFLFSVLLTKNVLLS